MKIVLTESHYKRMIKHLSNNKNKKILFESKLASNIISISSNPGTAGFEGSRKGSNITITDKNLRAALLSMITRNDIGMMGNVFEDIAMVSLLPNVAGPGNYENLNDTFTMNNSPAADIGLDFANTCNVTNSSIHGSTFNIYELDGKSWSVKSTAAASESNFATKATAIGQLAACGLHKAQKISIENLDSQQDCYLKMGNFLKLNDEVHFKMGLCYYKYERDNSQIFITDPSQDRSIGLKNLSFVLQSIINTSLVSAAADNVDLLSKLIPKNYYEETPTGLYNMPTAESLTNPPEAFLKTEFNKLIDAISDPSNIFYGFDFKCVRNQYCIHKDKKKKDFISSNDKINHDNLVNAYNTAFDVYKQTKVNQPMGFSTKEKHLKGDDTFYDYISKNPSDKGENFTKDFKRIIATALINRFTKVLSLTFSLDANSDDYKKLISQIPDINNPRKDSVPVPTEILLKILLAKEGSWENFYRNAINDIPDNTGPGSGSSNVKTRLGKDRHTLLKPLLTSQLITTNIEKCVKDFFNSLISKIRATDSDYFSITKLRTTAINVSNLEKPAFEAYYVDPDDNIFKIKLIRKDDTNQQYTFKLTVPSNAEVEIKLSGTNITIVEGPMNIITGTTGWKELPEKKTKESIRIIDNDTDSAGLDINSIITTTISEYEAMQAKQSELLNDLLNLQKTIVADKSKDNKLEKILADISSQYANRDAITTNPSESDIYYNLRKNTLFYMIDGNLYTAIQANQILKNISSAMESIGVLTNRLLPVDSGYLSQQMLQYKLIIDRLTQQNLTINSLVDMSIDNNKTIRENHTNVIKNLNTALKTIYVSIQSLADPADKATKNGIVRQFIQASGIYEDTDALNVIVTIPSNNPPFDRATSKYLFELKSNTDIVDISSIYLAGKTVLYGCMASVIASLDGNFVLANESFKIVKVAGDFLKSILSKMSHDINVVNQKFDNSNFFNTNIDKLKFKDNSKSNNQALYDTQDLELMENKNKLYKQILLDIVKESLHSEDVKKIPISLSESHKKRLLKYIKNHKM